MTNGSYTSILTIMPHVSRRILDKRTQELIEDALASLLANLSSSEVKKVFSVLLTDTERLMIAKRVAAAFFIRENVPESKIAEILKLTRLTVSRFMLLIKVGSQETWEFIFKKLERWDRFSTLKQILKETALSALKTFSRGMAGKI